MNGTASVVRSSLPPTILDSYDHSSMYEGCHSRQATSDVIFFTVRTNTDKIYETPLSTGIPVSFLCSDHTHTLTLQRHHQMSYHRLSLQRRCNSEMFAVLVVGLLFFTSVVEGFFLNNKDVSLSTGTTKTNIPSNIKLLILPGFGNDSKDYFDQMGEENRSLVSSLKEQGWSTDQISVLPVERSDWLQVFTRSIGDIQFWQGNAPPTRPAFRWYLERISNELSTLEVDQQMILIGHSAGGWLGRAALGFGSTDSVISDDKNNPQQSALYVDLSKVMGLVTLGSPHLPPPPTIMDMTRGALRITNERFPGAYHQQTSSSSNKNLFYITVMGVAIRGVQQVRNVPWEATTVSGFAFNSYESVCGDGTTIGDGVVPQCSGHLDGALQLDLDGVFHSINAPDNWYGSIGNINRWHTTMLEQVRERQQKGNISPLSMKLPFQLSLPTFNTER